MSTKNGKIVKQKNSDVKLFHLKTLTKWLLGKQRVNIKSVLESDDFERNYKYRLFILILNNPKLIYYCNKYLNNIYVFHKFEPIEWVTTFAQLFKLHNIQYQNDLYFSRYQNLDRNNFTKLLTNYFKQFGVINQDEINNLYKLYQFKIISNDHLENVKLVTDGNSKQRSVKKQKQIDVSEIEIKQQNSAELLNFTSRIMEVISSRNPCRNCSLYGKGSLILDTNLERPGPVDVAIVGLSPSPQDISNQTVFSDESGKHFRLLFSTLQQKYNLDFMFTYSLLCNSHGVDAKGLKKIFPTCSPLVNEIFKVFKPKIIILYGSKVKDSFGFKSAMTKLNNTIIENKFLMYSYDEKPRKIEESFMKLDTIFTKIGDKKDKQTLSIDQSKIENTVSRIEQNYTLFDVRIIGEQVVYVLCDENGKKKFMTEQVNYPIYIKNGMMKDCDYITDKISATVHVTNQQKMALQGMLMKNLKNTIGS